MKANLKLSVSVVFFMAYVAVIGLTGCAGVNEDEDKDNIPRVSPTSISLKSAGERKAKVVPNISMKNRTTSSLSEDGEVLYSSEEEYGNQLPIMEVTDAILEENQLIYLVDYDSRYIPEISVNLLNSAFFENDGFIYKRDADSDIVIECADKDKIQDMEEDYASDSEIVRIVNSDTDIISFQGLENAPGEVNIHLLLKYIALGDPEMAVFLQIRIKLIVSDKLRPKWIVFNDKPYTNSRLVSADAINSFGVILFTFATDENTNLMTTNDINIHIPADGIPIWYAIIDMRSGKTVINEVVTNFNTFTYSDAYIYGSFSCYLTPGLYQIEIKAPPNFYDQFSTSYLVEITN